MISTHPGLFRDNLYLLTLYPGGGIGEKVAQPAPPTKFGRIPFLWKVSAKIIPFHPFYTFSIHFGIPNLKEYILTIRKFGRASYSTFSSRPAPPSPGLVYSLLYSVSKDLLQHRLLLGHSFGFQFPVWIFERRDMKLHRAFLQYIHIGACLGSVWSSSSIPRAEMQRICRIWKGW